MLERPDLQHAKGILRLRSNDAREMKGVRVCPEFPTEDGNSPAEPVDAHAAAGEEEGVSE